MSYTKQVLKVSSSDGIHELSGIVFVPEGGVKGFFHVVHGMTEHIDRYSKFMEDMCESGFICFGYNHLGHMNTVSDDELGFIADKNGWDLLAKDVKAFSDNVFLKYNRGNLPYYLMGHSMGSFVVRYASSTYVKPDKLIVMGTGGSNPAAGAGLAVIALIKLLFGKKHFSPFVDKLAFGNYNDRFGGGSKDDPKSWLTNDTEEREKYYSDKYCMFNFTVSAMGDLIRIMKYSNSKKCYASLPEKLPVLLVSGKDDPVGNYGKGVLEVRDRLLKNGITVNCKLYEGARHEILNDVTYDEVKADILNFCVSET